jgi:hypothetical protein
MDSQPVVDMRSLCRTEHAIRLRSRNADSVEVSTNCPLAGTINTLLPQGNPWKMIQAGAVRYRTDFRRDLT